MIVKKIIYSTQFVKELRKLPKEIIAVAIQKEDIFKDNPLHQSLRLHELHGKFKGIWSISFTSAYRIIFERMKNGDILFISIGKHDIYKYL
ncbi:type II toxin-antitoxin system mRNA interferase toxin, RelE/StbE family [Candidatus Uhrbacteria bacterium CG_4_9_14_3_um_filter_36_7]|uniref:Type II toxin-antitoxin system mRNA interferase toxin, RelE/StbE family n=1 Tax=Candidatus Uhrbacteria bacterium CG_4_9_14_3_um_filter_36_7 TaxID=1975033 RepID=A0A2M7XIF2_9BACT|nr:MAG: type II toxin-antitoxin system mRNA interferase toxin, RelE/StbE family [Candidatus Uhrbacteria bacterium CG_4_9_14_3_um_filter_36_7]